MGVLVALAVVAGASPALGARSDVWPYTVYRPANLSKAASVPLVVVPAYGDIQAAQAQMNLDAAADRDGFVVVWAQIVKSYNDVVRANGEDPAHPYPDMLDLGSVIDQVVASQNIDPTRVFMTGMSASGTLSYRAACVLASKLAGIAPVESVVENPSCRPSRPVSVFAVNGTADPASPYNGGDGFLSVSAVMALWRGYDSCPSNASTRSLSSTATLTTWGPCHSGTVVQFASVNGGGHSWPLINGVAHFDGATEIGSFFMSLHGAQSTPAQLSAKLLAVTVKSGPPRKILVRLSSTLAAAGKATLALAGKTVYSHRVSVSSGAASVTLVVPAKLRKGTYRLTVSLASAATGGAVTMRRTVHLPR
jgi:polyhydroxybutyrate depolymerase